MWTTFKITIGAQIMRTIFYLSIKTFIFALNSVSKQFTTDIMKFIATLVRFD